ncbi:hypothetical protein MOB41_16350 [Bacillus haynesii]|uniref:hypothetical protein n=1 Tax=Bacillus haynesii TaxID=1925021 RepID=UPI00227E0377|nr:hypothetical protein [Bacillus haynesii]MCY7779972.1 hypothetical protein [Bacillus haynesii]MEC0669747.1 hypothetical protein [Bacillus haynesii]MEC1477056.1 hypothetical protein [Bacillus haynesii]
MAVVPPFFKTKQKSFAALHWHNGMNPVHLYTSLERRGPGDNSRGEALFRPAIKMLAV